LHFVSSLAYKVGYVARETVPRMREAKSRYQGTIGDRGPGGSDWLCIWAPRRASLAPKMP